jgi:hypothetical protein
MCSTFSRVLGLRFERTQSQPDLAPPVHFGYQGSTSSAMNLNEDSHKHGAVRNLNLGSTSGPRRRLQQVKCCYSGFWNDFARFETRLCRSVTLAIAFLSHWGSRHLD